MACAGALEVSNPHPARITAARTDPFQNLYSIPTNEFNKTSHNTKPRRVEEKNGFLKFQKNRSYRSRDITPNVRVSPFCGALDREMYDVVASKHS
jgi:hypothetical protein